MAAILAVVDIEDLATPKIQGVKDSLTELTTVQEIWLRGLAGGASAIQSATNALDAYRTSASLLSKNMREIQAALAPASTAVTQLTGSVNQGTSAVIAYLESLAQLTVQQKMAAEAARLYISGLTALATTMKAGAVATKEQAAALSELNTNTGVINGMTAQYAATITELNEKVKQGVPLKQQDLDALEKVANGLAGANKEALGLTSALQQLMEAYRAEQAVIQQTAQGMAFLAATMKEGVDVSALQKEAFDELATAAQGVAQLADADKVAFAALNAQLQIGIPLTADQATEMQRLAVAMRDAVTGTQEETSALQQLIAAEQQKLALTREQAAAAEVMERALTEGTEVTQNHADAVKEMNTAVQGNAQISEKARTSLEQLTYTLDVGQKVSGQQAQAFKEVSAELKGAAAGATQAGTAMESLAGKGAIAAAVWGALAAAIQGFLKSSVDVAARVEVLGTVMRVMGQNTSSTTYDMTVQEMVMRKLGITTMESRNAVISFVQAELDLADAGKIARAAQDLAVAAGENSSATMQRLTTAIQLQQPRLLRQIGIVASLDEIYRKYAQTTGQTVAQLDAVEKKQAFVNRILEEGAKAAGTYESALDDVGKKVASLDRLSQELRKEIGDRLLPVYGQLIDMVTASFKWWNSLSEIWKDLIVTITAVAGALALLNAAFAGAKFAVWIAGLTGISAAMKTVSTAAGPVGMLGRLGAVAKGAAGLVPQLRLLGLVLTGLTVAWNVFSSAREENHEAALESSAQMTGEIERIEDLSAAVLKNKEDVNANTASRKEAAVAMEELERIAPEVARVLRAEVVDQQALAAAVRDTTAARREGRAELLTNMKAALESARAERREVAKAQAEVMAEQKKFQKDRPWDVRGLGAMNARILGYQNELKALDELIEKRHAAAYALDWEAQREAARLRMQEDAIIAIETLGKTKEQQARRIRQLGMEVEAEEVRTMMKMKKGADGVIRAVLENGKQILLTAQEIELRKRQILEANDKLVEKEMARQKKWQQAYESAREQLEGEGTVGGAKLQAMEDALKGVTQGTEEYKDMITRASDILEYFNKQNDELKAKFPGVAAAAAQVKQVKLAEEIRGWRVEMRQTVDEFDTFTKESLRTLREELEATRSQGQTFEGERQRLAVMEEVYQQEKEYLDQITTQRMTAQEKAIYVETERVNAIERQLQREKQLRELAFMEEEYLARQRFELMKQESDRRLKETLKAMRMQDIEYAAQQQFLVDQNKLTQEEMKAGLARRQIVRNEAIGELALLNEGYKAALNVERDFNLQVLEGRRQRAQEEDELRKRGFAATVNGSRETLLAIKDQYDDFRNAVAQFWSDIVHSATDAFVQMMTGAQTFAEGMKGIWESIKSAFFRMVDGLIDKWINGFLEGVLSESAGKGVGGFLKELGNQIKGGFADIAKNAINFFNYIRGLFGGGAQTASTVTQVAGQGTNLAGQAFGVGGAAITPMFGAGTGSATLGGITAGTLPSGAAAPIVVPGTSGALGGGVGSGALGVGLGSVVGGGVGFGVGYGLTNLTGKKYVGVMGGMLAGGLVGFAAGGPIGGGIGLVGGLIGGLLGKDEAEKVEEAREEVGMLFGGIENLRQAAVRAGVDVDKLFETEEMEEFDRELRKIQLSEQMGGMRNVDRLAQLSGYGKRGLIRLFHSDDDEEWEKNLAEFQKAVEALEKKIKALGEAANGLQLRTQGFAEQLQKDMEWLWDGMGEDIRRNLTAAFEDAVKKGFTGNKMQWFIQYMKDIADGGRNLFGVVPRTIEEFQKLMVQAQKSFDRIGLYAAGIFQEVLVKTGDLNAAMQAIGPTLDMLIALQEQFDFTSSEALGTLLRLRAVMVDNADVADSLSGLTMILKGLMDAGALTKEMFQALGADVAEQFDILRRRGVTEDDAMLMTQPALQKLWEVAQDRPGYLQSLDAETQALLKRAEEAGLIGEEFSSTARQMLNVLKQILAAIELQEPPKAIPRPPAPGEPPRVPPPTSPTPIPPGQRWPTPLETQMVADYAEQRRMTAFHQGPLGGIPEPPEPDAQTTADFDTWLQQQEASGGWTQPWTDEAGGLPTVVEPGEPSALGVDGEVVTEGGLPEEERVPVNAINITINALDGASVEAVWRQKIVPQLQLDLDRNTGQLTSVMESRLSRYRTD